MSRIYKYILFAGVSFGILLLLQNNSVVDSVGQYVVNGEIQTLEARFTAEQIMQIHWSEILGDNKQRTFREAQLKFYPYLLLDVKYPQPNKESREGVILWSMMDGEMVLNTDSWEKTHGFEDALNAGANMNEFKILNTLARNKGVMTIQQLQKSLHLDVDVIMPWINSAIKKHLILQHGSELQLHFQNPKILVAPHTQMNEWIVSKPYSQTNRVAKKYSRSQIEKTAQAAFGQGFTIRGAKEVFLPVYSIETINPDGSVLTSFWNAINGRRINRTWRG